MSTAARRDRENNSEVVCEVGNRQMLPPQSGFVQEGGRVRSVPSRSPGGDQRALVGRRERNTASLIRQTLRVQRAAGRQGGTQPGSQRQAWAQLKLSVSCSDLQTRRLRMRGAFGR